MTCAEKKELQDQCTAACDEFEKATRDVNSSTGILLDLRAKKISLTKPLNVKDWRFEFTKLFAEARWRHLRASTALSRHLSEHTC